MLFPESILVVAITPLQSPTILLLHILALHVILGLSFLSDLRSRLLLAHAVVILAVTALASLSKSDAGSIIIGSYVVKDTDATHRFVGLLLPLFVQLAELDLFALHELTTLQPNLFASRLARKGIAHGRLDVLPFALIPSHHALSLDQIFSFITNNI